MIFISAFWINHKSTFCAASSPWIAEDKYWPVILGKSYHMTISTWWCSSDMYTTAHLLSLSTSQKQHVRAGRKDGCLPISWQGTQFNLLALSTIISTSRQGEKNKFPLSPLLQLFLLCLFTGKIGFVLMKAKRTYMLISNKNTYHTEVSLYWSKMRSQGQMF